ncbi:MAG: RiPP maturation radical SAM C-methyltransferase [Deltaproteobacteria bacterium]|nr:RiPP maturation radical SAM C-methyltransferase [Deltaproteobacteria bacterium]
MKSADRGKPIRSIALVATPWALFDRPSIQIAALKAYLDTHLPGLQTQSLHLFLNVADRLGYQPYAALSRRTWLAESVYGALLHPERLTRIEKMYVRYASRAPELKKMPFDQLVKRVEKISDHIIAAHDWRSMDMAGFSVSMCQLTAALYFIRKIKSIHPAIKVVVGGSTFCGPSITAYLDHFRDIDFIVVGEGESPLKNLLENLNGGDDRSRSAAVPGVVSREGSRQKGGGFVQLANLDKLPCPDYTEYFQQVERFSPEKRFFPTIPVEASRGCWWRHAPKHVNGTEESSPNLWGCAFCNLNLQWDGYRKKAPNRVAREIDTLTAQHKTLSVVLVDNVIPSGDIAEPFRKIIELNKEFKLFGEIRADTPLSALKRMKMAGMHEVQVGIESLSTSLLKKMNKGTSVIQNVEIMKHCETLGLKNVSNLILNFPGSDLEDIAETLAALTYTQPFQPLKPVKFWLGLESPVWRLHRRYGIKSVANHPGYGTLFPEETARSLRFIIQAYRGDVVLQRKRWRVVEKSIEAWQHNYAALHSRPFSGPILGYRDGGTFLIITQRRPNEESATHRLTGLSRKIYLFCDTNRAFTRILAAFPGLEAEKLSSFLEMMLDKRLMFREKDRYLSLASPIKACATLL